MSERNTTSKNGATIGVSDHCGWAVLVTVASDGKLLDRRRAEILEEGLPKLPHHHEAQSLPRDKAVALVERVRDSAERHASLALDAVAAAVPVRIICIALRECPPLPPTITERIENYRAQNVADTVMYRTALARAAKTRGWDVHWYHAKRVVEEARVALRMEEIDSYFHEVRRSVGPPWQKDHTVAMAAAIVAANGVRR